MRRKSLYLIPLLISISFYCSGQVTFQKSYGGSGQDKGYCVQQTSDGGYIIAGYTNSYGAGLNDVYLIKTDSNGTALWLKSYGESGNDVSLSVQQTLDSGYIIAGRTTSFGASAEDVYIIKTDAGGNLLWSKTFGSVSFDESYSVQQTNDGGFIISGRTTYSFGSSSLHDIYLIKIDLNGNMLWTKTFGGTGYEYGFSIQQTFDDGYILGGFTTGFGAGNEDAYLLKTDTSGNMIWFKTYGGTGLDIGNYVQQTSDSGYIVIGYTASFGVGGKDVYLFKTNISGDIVWSKTFGGILDDYGNCVQQTADGGYILAGHTMDLADTTNKIYLIKTNVNGDTLWTKTYGTTGVNYWGYFVQQTIDDGYIISGWKDTSGFDVYLLKTDTNGNSDCNEMNIITFGSTPVTQVNIPVIMNSSGNYIHNAATLTGSGGTATTLCSSVGIKEIKNDHSINISPNPSAGNFIISFEGNYIKGSVNILNIFGENVYSENISNESQKEIQLKNVSNGIYMIKILDGEESYCKKLIIEQE